MGHLNIRMTPLIHGEVPTVLKAFSLLSQKSMSAGYPKPDNNGKECCTLYQIQPVDNVFLFVFVDDVYS